jgi:hypothetical protein
VGQGQSGVVAGLNPHFLKADARLGVEDDVHPRRALARRGDRPALSRVGSPARDRAPG